MILQILIVPYQSIIFIVLNNQLAKYAKFHITYNDPALVLKITPLKTYISFQAALTNLNKSMVLLMQIITWSSSLNMSNLDDMNQGTILHVITKQICSLYEAECHLQIPQD